MSQFLAAYTSLITREGCNYVDFISFNVQDNGSVSIEIRSADQQVSLPIHKVEIRQLAKDIISSLDRLCPLDLKVKREQLHLPFDK